MSTIPKITITINADSPEDFRKVLAGLLTAGAQSITTVYNNVEPPVTEKAQAAAGKAAKATTTAKPKDEPKPEPEQPQRETKLVEPAKEFAEPKQEAKPEPAKEEPKKATSKKAAAPEPSGNAPELPDNIKNTNSMRDLLTYLAEHGVDSADAMVATCTVLKKDVPILSKVPNVEERVRRALDVLALFPANGDEAAGAQA